MQQRRILGIDYGEKRVGLSLSDPLGILAKGIGTLVNDHSLIAKIKSIVDQHDVGQVVIGMPYNLKGHRGVKAVEVEKFIKVLRRELSVPVVSWDERFTSRMAHEAMIQFGMKRKARQDKSRVDEMASALLLQNYLDYQKSHKNH